MPAASRSLRAFFGNGFCAMPTTTTSFAAIAAWTSCTMSVRLVAIVSRIAGWMWASSRMGRGIDAVYRVLIEWAYTSGGVCADQHRSRRQARSRGHETCKGEDQARGGGCCDAPIRSNRPPAAPSRAQGYRRHQVWLRLQAGPQRLLMVLVDTSVWIDFLRGAPTAQVATLDALLEGD